MKFPNCKGIVNSRCRLRRMGKQWQGRTHPQCPQISTVKEAKRDSLPGKEPRCSKARYNRTLIVCTTNCHRQDFSRRVAHIWFHFGITKPLWSYRVGATNGLPHEFWATRALAARAETILPFGWCVSRFLGICFASC